MHQAPASYGRSGTCWHLADLLQVFSTWHVRSVPGMSRLLTHLHLHLKQARRHVHSPDEHYREKLRSIWVVAQSLRASPDPPLLFFQD